MLTAQALTRAQSQTKSGLRNRRRTAKGLQAVMLSFVDARPRSLPSVSIGFGQGASPGENTLVLRENLVPARASSRRILKPGSLWALNGHVARAGLRRGVSLSSAPKMARPIPLVPRLLAAGADLGRVHIISAVRIEDKGRRSFNLRADLDLLERKIVELGDVGLIRIDPISSYLGKTDSHNNAEVRGVLAPIAEMAERMRIAILSITHFSKTGAASTTKALHRFIGSIAFVGAPRAAFAVIEDSSDTERRLLLHAKNNLAAPPQGLAFRLKQTIVGDLGKGIVASRVEWEQEPVTVTADEALAAEAAGAADTSSGVEAENFLTELLAEGPVPAKQVRADVEAAALSWSTVKRAKARLGIKAEKDGMDGGWSWSLPRRGSNLSEEDHVLNVSPFVPDEPLRQDAISDELPDLPAFLDRRVRT